MPRSIKQSDLSAFLETFIETGETAVILGQPGIGKSDIIRQVANKLGYRFEDKRLAYFNPEDILGLPMMGKDHNDISVMKFARPSWLPTDPDEKVLIFFDEITLAQQSVLNTTLQLILDRRIDNYELPKNVRIIAAGNTSLHKTGARDLPAALVNRVCLINLQVSFEDWQIWAIQNKVNPEVIGYLSFSPQNLCPPFDAKIASGPYPTPRTWCKVAKMLYSNLPKHLIPEMICGYVGEPVGLDFIAQRENWQNLPNPKDVFSGKYGNDFKFKNSSAQFTTVIGCNAKLKSYFDVIGKNGGVSENEWNKMANNYIGFMNDNCTKEVSLMAISQAIKTLEIRLSPNKIPNYKGFYEKNRKLLSAVCEIL